MAFKARGQFTAGTSRSGKSYYHGGRRVLISSPTFQLEWAGESLERFARDVVEAVFEQLSEDALALMQSNTPVDTGELRDSEYVRIFVRAGRTYLQIGARAEHAVFVELGTADHPAQPYIRPTFDWVVAEVRSRLREEANRRGA